MSVGTINPADVVRKLPADVRLEALQATTRRHTAYRAFQDRYRYDMAGFVADCVRWRPGEDGFAPYQEKAARWLVDERRVSMRGPHGLGKTAFAALAILWFALTRDGRDDWKVPTTASAWRQLTKFLWPEARKWANRLDWKAIGRPPFQEGQELLSLSLKLETGEAFAAASSDPQLIEGAHADSLLYVFDEAKAIPGDIFDAAEGAFAGAGDDTAAEAFALAISTPGEPQGRFYEIHKRQAGYEDWHAFHVSLQECIAAGRVSRAWAEQRKRQWGNSAAYMNRVLGEFASSEEDGVIPLAHVELANERWHALNESGEWPPFTAVGVDVGRGGDPSVEALRFGNAIRELRRHSERDTMAVTGRTKGILDRYGGRAVIDVIGIGAGVVDRLREQNVKGVVAFNAGSRTDRTDESGELGFVDKRSAAWWNMRELLNPDNGHDVALPPDDKLTGDLTAPKWRTMSGGKIKVEKKDEIKKRLGRSTDDGDAVIQAFWSDAQEPGFGDISDLGRIDDFESKWTIGGS